MPWLLSLLLLPWSLQQSNAAGVGLVTTLPELWAGRMELVLAAQWCHEEGRWSLKVGQKGWWVHTAQMAERWVGGDTAHVAGVLECPALNHDGGWGQAGD